jgi:hypothetical protein
LQLKPVFITSYSVSGSVDTRVDLRLTIGPDGSARMDGAILVVSALDGPMPVGDSGPTRRLVARGTDTQASCADADGDGQTGIVQIAAELLDARSGEPVRIMLETEPTRDIDERGTYPLTLMIGDERWTLDARVTLAPARRRKSRGRERKGRRRR